MRHYMRHIKAVLLVTYLFSAMCAHAQIDKPKTAAEYCEKISTDRELKNLADKYETAMTRLDNFFQLVDNDRTDLAFKSFSAQLNRAYLLGVDGDKRKTAKDLLEHINRKVPPKDAFNQDAAIEPYLQWFAACANNLQASSLKYFFLNPLNKSGIDNFYKNRGSAGNQLSILSEMWQGGPKISAQGINAMWVSPMVILLSKTEITVDLSEANARMDKLLSDMEESSKQIASSNAGVKGYCARLLASDSVNTIAGLMEKYKANGDGDNLYLDNKSGDLKKWVAQKISEKPATLKKGIEFVNRCFADNYDSPVYRLTLSWNTDKDKDRNRVIIDKSFEERSKNFGGPNLNSQQATLLAFLFDGADDFISKIKPNPVAEYQKSAQARLEEEERNRKNAARQKAAEEASAKAEQEWEAENKKNWAREEAFLNTAEGKLVFAYQRYQVIQVCHEMRKGLALQFITAQDLGNSQEKMKKMEAQLKKSLKDKNTDALWAKAEERNRKWDLTGGFGGKNPITTDLIEHIKTTNKTDWAAAKSDCQAMFVQFNAHANEQIGTEKIKKDF